jgi:hypothetical protein
MSKITIKSVREAGAYLVAVSVAAPYPSLLDGTKSVIVRRSREMKLVYKSLAALSVLAAVAAVFAVPQYRTAREAENGTEGTPKWSNPEPFKKDVFTFVRVKYVVDGRYGWGHTRPEERWMIDFPEADLNLSFRLQQLTSLKVDPDTKTVELTEKELYDYPFIYIVESGRGTCFSDEEVSILRKYLLNGGFLMFDDFWGDREWNAFYQEIKRVFPDREIEDLPPEHPIFHCVFDLKEPPQVPGEPHWPEFLATGKTWERGEDTRHVHYRGIKDDKGRLMVLICHNTDLGDGWEREGYNEGYFHQFSEKSAYPLAVNIVYYVMTH